MAEFLVKVYCPKCYTQINVKLSELHPGASIKCPKCGADVKFNKEDTKRVLEELGKIEDTIKTPEK
ncbi:MAG: hypothetical protein HN929_05890 [Chloroflexi bacterium]|jgi:predicted Zn finger-like uncharacterized protein|nr:hypothetical protein [Chloroflexota bacterium]MBT7080982.1 hypothetical protein [Chloroflexota bacterium]